MLAYLAITVDHVFCVSGYYSGPCFLRFFNSAHQDTPLHLAAKAGHLDTVKCLVELGADINIKDAKFGVCE